MDIQELSINAIRCVGNDAINKANSGHPGMVLGSAPIMYTLYTKFMKATTKENRWINRDRFVLASGHASMLLYMTFNLCGYNVTMDDIKNFRQLNSITAGHPEYTAIDAIDCTSGPLGQGIAHAVGLAMAEKFMAETFNKEDCKIVDNYTYALCGDGDMEEGVTQEAISLAAAQKLNKLIVLYDSNAVTLDGKLDLSFKENVKERFQACGWKVFEVDGFNTSDIEKALKKAKKNMDGPSLIICKTIIGYASANQGTNKVHGSPIGADLDNVKAKLGWTYAPFEVPQEVYDHYQETFGKRGLKEYRRWKRLVREYRMRYPKDYQDYEAALTGNYKKKIVYPVYPVGTNEATRVTSGKVINVIAPQIRTILGGASDVAGSVNTMIKDAGIFGQNLGGHNVYYGIREFAMSCAQTGLLLYGGIRPFVGCFLVFSDYLKPSIRTAALMKVPSINIFTHDSIAVGEDGPTHQPIEQVSALRLIPDTYTIRPSGAIETTHAWHFAIDNNSGPVNIICSRQNIVATCAVSYEDFCRGAFIAKKEQITADYIIMASGSEVPLAIEVALELEKHSIDTRVVSVPCLELFNKQDELYQASIIGIHRSKIIAIEMGSSGLWYKHAKQVIGLDEFGKSGKANDVINDFGFTAQQIVEKII